MIATPVPKSGVAQIGNYRAPLTLESLVSAAWW
jgi:hypothetical protein